MASGNQCKRSKKGQACSLNFNVLNYNVARQRCFQSLISLRLGKLDEDLAEVVVGLQVAGLGGVDR